MKKTLSSLMLLSCLPLFGNVFDEVDDRFTYEPRKPNWAKYYAEQEYMRVCELIRTYDKDQYSQQKEYKYDYIIGYRDACRNILQFDDMHNQINQP